MRPLRFRKKPRPVPAAGPAAPSEQEWAQLPARPQGPTLDVIMPVYAGRAETLRALHRVLSARNATAFELVVVNDCSPDPEIVARLKDLAERKLITLVTNASNRGFVASCNAAAALHPERDFILLNADTEVFGDWIDRLKAVADGAGDVATVTPMSNAATIVSYPVFLQDHHAPLEIGDGALDRLMAALGHAPVEIPTGVGFCMYVRRRAWAELAGFNEHEFGRGYGEENDFCRRAAGRGWRHLAAPNVFIRHHSGRSFGAEKDARVRAAVDIVERLHPGYRRLIHQFIGADPLAAFRRQVDEARIRKASPANILTFGGGGAGTNGLGIIRLVPRGRLFVRRHSLRADRAPTTPNLPLLDLRNPPSDMASLLHALGVVRVDPSGAGPLSRNARKLAALAQRIGLEVAAR